MGSKKNPRVPGITRNAKAAPFEPCIGCFRGDTDTGLVLQGSAEFIIAGLSTTADMSVEEASATAELAFRENYTTDPGMVPGGELSIAVRLCRDCAAKTGAQVAPLSSEALPGYRESMMFPEETPE
jgi:hypothetical protein